METEKLNLTAIKINNEHLVFNTPNDLCLWRVKTLLTKEPSTIKWLDSLEKSDVLWDVGANMGLYSIYAAYFKKCQVYAFEPESQNYALLNRNISLNKSKNITAYCLAISNEIKINKLGLSNTNAGSSGHSIDSKNVLSQGCVTYSINELVNLNLQPPTHLKIDIDGLDHLVVYGADKILSSLTSILIELDTANKDQMKILDYLENFDFYYDPKQVASTARPKGDKFENLREYIFIKY